MLIASYAPKEKTCSTTDSLQSRVGVTVATERKSYMKFWSDTFDEFNLHMDQNLIKVLNTMNKKKDKKRKRSATKEDKRKRNEEKYRKLNTALADDIKTQKDNTGYKQGIAMAQVE